MKVEKRLEELGLTLPEAPTPAGTYLSAKRQGNLLYLAGAGPTLDGKAVYEGKVGAEVSLEDAYKAAQLTMLNLLAVMKKELGDLDRVKSVVKVLGLVACAPGFYATPAVINGASDLLFELYGEAGRHARSAIGVFALPINIPVEVEMIVEVE